MIIISHRGYWQSPPEKNTMAAFERSFKNGLGLETDVRDYKGQLVVSHDIPNENSISMETFLNLYKSIGDNLYLALNIKSDGLQSVLSDLIQQFEVKNYFVFDMSVPDGLNYLRKNMNVFTRQSEFETTPSFYNEAEGVWLDEFNSHWITDEVIKKHLMAEKKICIVSPELHGRSYNEEWRMYKKIEQELKPEAMMLCTDFPEKAKKYFNE